MIRTNLRFILDADSRQELSQDIIDGGRRALGWPQSDTTSVAKHSTLQQLAAETALRAIVSADQHGALDNTLMDAGRLALALTDLPDTSGQQFLCGAEILLYCAEFLDEHDACWASDTRNALTRARVEGEESLVTRSALAADLVHWLPNARFTHHGDAALAHALVTSSN